MYTSVHQFDQVCRRGVHQFDQVSVYGAKSDFRSRSLASLHLMVAEGHVLGQVLATSY